MATRVKFLSKANTSTRPWIWLRQTPGNTGKWGDVEFLFDNDAREYDWLVVYDDLPPTRNERFSRRTEDLACPPQNTILFTMEPAGIKAYGSRYIAQFGSVYTSQEPWAMQGDHVIRGQQGLLWLYGVVGKYKTDWDSMHANPPLNKTHNVSSICSNKQFKHTQHRARFEFCHALKRKMSEMELFGRGINPVEDKREALDRFKYHVTIENEITEHYWSEKLADAFLGATLPIYHGAPNVEDYFPADSLIRIDINQPQRAMEFIQAAVAANEYEKRLTAILEARRRVLEEHNIFAVIARHIHAHARARNRVHEAPPGSGKIRSRRNVIRRSPFSALQYVVEKTSQRRRFKRLQQGQQTGKEVD